MVDVPANFEREVAVQAGYKNTVEMRSAASNAKNVIFNIRKHKILWLKEHGYDLVDISQAVYGDTDHITAVINILKMTENDKED
jgi:hypothetical protein